MSGIPLVLGFERGMASPLDVDAQKADITARNAIETYKRWEGMTCYVISEGKTYTLIGGLANSNWQPLVAGGAVWGSITGLLPDQLDLWVAITGNQQISFDASDLYSVTGSEAYFDDTLGAVFPQGVDSSLLIKMASPYRWDLASLAAQISWQHGTPSGGGYMPYFGVPAYWGDTTKFGSPYPTWDGTKYADIVSDVDIAPTGSWATGFRPTSCRVTIDVTIDSGSLLQDVVLTIAGIDGPYIDAVLGVNQVVVDLSSLSIDIDRLGLFWPHDSPTYNITSIEFLTDAGGTGVEFDVSARVLNNADADTQAFGTAVTLSDTGGTDGTRYITPRSTNVAPGGTPAKGCDIEVKITRTGTTDTLSADAYLQNIRLFLDADQPNDNEAV